MLKAMTYRPKESYGLGVNLWSRISGEIISKDKLDRIRAAKDSKYESEAVLF